MNDPGLPRRLEGNEGRAYARLVEGAPAPLRAACDLRVERIAGAHVFVAGGGRETLLLNRVIGLGVEQPVTPSLLDELDRLYLRRGAPAYAFEVAPMAAPPELLDELRGRGFVPFKQTTMMWRGCADAPVAETSLTVRRVGTDHAAAFAALCGDVFGFGHPVPALLQASFGHPGTDHWLAFDGDAPVAAAMTVCFDDGSAWIGWACTLPSHRGRGAQSALAAAQLQGCSERGVRTVTLEAATGSRRRPSTSLRNYARMGWVAAYDRIVMLRRLGAASAGVCT